MLDDKEKNIDWERKTIQNLLQGSIAEQRRSRRWGIFFKITTLIYFFLLLFVFSDFFVLPAKLVDHTALVDISGEIGAEENTNAENVINWLQAAYSDPRTKGVILRINSPGGSPVQSRLIFDELVRLRELHPDIPLYSVVEDLCASGAYYIAIGTQNIYADKSSIIGSIGVLINGFGFTDSLHKLGIERRLLSAGKNKAFLDPFSPMKEDDQAHAQTMLKELHEQFINAVVESRGDKLVNNKKLFSGLIWTGEKSLKLGLIDGFGSSEYVAREVLKTPQIVNFTEDQGAIEKIVSNLGEVIGKSIIGSIREIKVQ